jgi:hypothetical protein
MQTECAGKYIEQNSQACQKFTESWFQYYYIQMTAEQEKIESSKV